MSGSALETSEAMSRNIGSKSTVKYGMLNINLTIRSPDRRENDPPTYEGFGDPKPWRVINHCRYTSRPGKPHSIMSCIAQVWPDASQGLTSHELRAIVNMMLLRVNHKPFRRCHIHPVSEFPTLYMIMSKICTDSGSLFYGRSSGENHSSFI